MRRQPQPRFGRLEGATALELVPAVRPATAVSVAIATALQAEGDRQKGQTVRFRRS